MIEHGIEILVRFAPFSKAKSLIDEYNGEMVNSEGQSKQLYVPEVKE